MVTTPFHLAVYTKPLIPANQSHIPRQTDIDNWPHMSGITLPQLDAGIDLLIGNNIPDVYTPLEIKTGPRGRPYATKTLLGWVICSLQRYSSSSQGIFVNSYLLYIFLRTINDWNRCFRRHFQWIFRRIPYTTEERIQWRINSFEIWWSNLLSLRMVTTSYCYHSEMESCCQTTRFKLYRD